MSVHKASFPPLSDAMGVAILGLKNKGGFKICRIQGDLLVCGG